ncbi:acyl-CoA synthetase (AMP-forming)/AMP-acid ligase II [Brevundimonas bullata]|uniref:Acyl-CoA synthetase (AMP-forming)/AMP-acid ligase II n=1 Tax=Brevundimonas bullata TaxID=13160 RepID=A0A7W7IRK3_9CAUL|nr:class I adenylate-forming enzyme family protein [Brevundimonas bullata]MBB4799254.1 acyl-CoA synthetase (AMP-forming)/AMP-acid ligase II [Brevundimonas bullata]MBB6384052.1 acyl-CoA synthetase (AMP-forming)/AMP-acid ligase II [Brevundimonas bullata]
MIVVPEERIRDFKARGWWGEETLDDLFRRHVAAMPDAESVVDPINREAIMGGAPARLTWAEVEDRVARYVAVLHATGVGRDDVVAVQLPNVIELGLIYLACIRLGAIVTPAPVQYREHELAYILRKTDAKAVVTAARIGKHAHAEMMLAVQTGAAALNTVLVVGGHAPDGTIDLDARAAGLDEAEIEAGRAAARAANICADDIVTICWTSGTEAEPKGVPRSHNEWIIMGAGVTDAADLKPGAVLLNPFPMVNMAGISTSFVSWLLLGGVLVQHQPFDLQIFLQQVRDEKIDYTVAPPAILNLLLQNEALLEGVDFGRLRAIGSGSAPLSEWMVRTFHEKYGVQIVNYFGSNEGASFPSAQKDVPDAAERAVLFPRLGDGFEWKALLHDRIFTRLVDPETEQEITEPGLPGELRVKGATVFSGYWRAPEINARAFDGDGWFRTGDLFELAGDRLQFYRFVGRLKDVIIRGGMNISSEEIEGHLIGHPAVADAAVVGAPDPNLGERLCAFVVFKPGQSADLGDINRFLTGDKHVAVYKQIERLEVIALLPRNPVGKVLKRELRQSLGDQSGHLKSA